MFDMRRIIALGLSLVGFLLSFDSAFAFRAYVSNEKGNSVSVIDTDKMEVIATVKTGQRPRGIEVSRDGKFVYVAIGDDDTVQIIDTKSLSIVGRIAVRSRPRTIRTRSRRESRSTSPTKMTRW